jgi:hypothetical protein
VRYDLCLSSCLWFHPIVQVYDYSPPEDMRRHTVKPWDPPFDLFSLGTEVKLEKSHRVKPGTIGPRFWEASDFVLGKVPGLGDLTSSLALPRGRLLCVPLGSVGHDAVLEWMCPCGTFKCSAAKDKYGTCAYPLF